MTLYRGKESPERREELFSNAQVLKTWLRVRRDISEAQKKAVAEYKKEKPKSKQIPPVHIVFPHIVRPGETPTQITQWTVPVQDVLNVCSRRISTAVANMHVTTVIDTYGLAMPTEDKHGKALTQRIQEQVRREPPGTYFPVGVTVLEPPAFLTHTVTSLNVDPGDVLYWTTLWMNYMREVLVNQAKKHGRESTATLLIKAPENIMDYGFRWQRRKRLIFDWQTVKMLEKVIKKIEMEMAEIDIEDVERARNRIHLYYEMLHQKKDPPEQPEGLFPVWLYFLPDILNLAFLPRGR